MEYTKKDIEEIYNKIYDKEFLIEENAKNGAFFTKVLGIDKEWIDRVLSSETLTEEEYCIIKSIIISGTLEMIISGLTNENIVALLNNYVVEHKESIDA